MKNELITFKDGTLELNVPVSWEQETVWLTRSQMAKLFERDVKTIGKHINNALKEELDRSTVANFATVQMEGGREVERNIEHYNLDMIISVGYRVKSTRGVQFRKWANSVLKQYILQGYAVNNNRIAQLGEVIQIMKRTQNALDSQQVLNVIQKYSKALELLDSYDHQNMERPKGNTQHMNSLMKNAWKLYHKCDLGQNQICSVKRKMIHSKAVLETSISLLPGRNCTRH